MQAKLIPAEFICPLSKEYMDKPVIMPCCDRGIEYECLAMHVAATEERCPNCGAEVCITGVLMDFDAMAQGAALKAEIEAFLAQNPDAVAVVKVAAESVPFKQRQDQVLNRHNLLTGFRVAQEAADQALALQLQAAEVLEEARIADQISADAEYARTLDI